MTLVSVDDSLIKEAMAELARKDEALVKAAAVQVELDVVYEVMNLVASGQIDPDDIIEKTAEFTASPEALQVYKKAVEMRSGGISLGRLTNSSEISKTASSDDPEARLFNTLTTIVK
jgi:hypothetical protein